MCSLDERRRHRACYSSSKRKQSRALNGLAADEKRSREKKDNLFLSLSLSSLSLSPTTKNRYNLKRKVAGLPPVTREWYDARAAALKASLTSGGGAGAASTSSSLLAGAARAWLDPLTRKKFSSEATYRTFVSSNKYKEMVKKSGQPAPEAVVVVHSLESGSGGGGGATTRSQAAAAAAAKKKQQQAAATTDVLPIMATPTTSDAATAAAFRVAAPNGVTFAAGNDMETEGEEEEEEDEAAGDDGSSGWETADDDGEDRETEPWDPTVSLFDNKKHDSIEACLEYMWKQFSFYIPDVAHCADPAGLLGYLGAKLRSGLVPLYYRGDDDSGRRFRSLHGVQRHMVDLGNCRVCWEGNEMEYAEWYEWSDDDDDGDGDDDVEMDSDDEAANGNPSSSATEEAFELALPNGKVIGARAFAKFFKQSHRPFARATTAGGAARALQAPLSGAGAAARAANLGSGASSGAASNSLALTAAGREQQRSAIVARYRAMGVKEADVPRAARKERQARKAQHRGRIRETLRSNLAANVNRNLPRNVPY